MDFSDVSKSTFSSSKEAATQLLTIFDEISPHMKDYEIRDNPVLMLAQHTLEHIAEHGGKVAPELIGMLANSRQHQTTLQELGASLQMDEVRQRSLTSTSKVADDLARAMLESGIVELPIVARGRGR